MDKFTYDRLDKGQIRLLALLSGLEDEPLTATLITVELSDSHNVYHALSYDWGSDEKPRTLQIAGTEQTISTTESAHLALRRLRADHACPGRPFIIWIDAICINQEDDEDRNQQVTMTADIYSHACIVLAHLGEEVGKSHEALQLLKGLRSQHDHEFFIFNQTVHTRLSRWMKPPTFNEALLARDLVSKGPQTRSVLVGLQLLLVRPCFDRIWMVQEVLVANEMIMICGRHRIGLEDFFFASMAIRDELCLHSQLYVAMQKSER